MGLKLVQVQDSAELPSIEAKLAEKISLIPELEFDLALQVSEQGSPSVRHLIRKWFSV